MVHGNQGICFFLTAFPAAFGVHHSTFKTILPNISIKEFLSLGMPVEQRVGVMRPEKKRDIYVKAESPLERSRTCD